MSQWQAQCLLIYFCSYWAFVHDALRPGDAVYSKCQEDLGVYAESATENVQELHKYTNLILNMLISSPGIFCVLPYLNEQIRLEHCWFLPDNSDMKTVSHFVLITLFLFIYDLVLSLTGSLISLAFEDKFNSLGFYRKVFYYIYEIMEFMLCHFYKDSIWHGQWRYSLSCWKLAEKIDSTHGFTLIVKLSLAPLA